MQITCYGKGSIGSFGEWIHSYSGKVIRTIPGTELNTTSTISFASCDFEDFGEYTCKAWNTIENQTYWSNVTTRLIIHGMAIQFRIFFNLNMYVFMPHLR